MNILDRTTDELRALVLRHNRLYWAGTPEIPDDIFDLMFNELNRREPDDPAVTELGERPEPRIAVRHAEPMLSLDKVYEEAKLERWLEGRQVVVTPKLDGVACVLTYDEHGTLVSAATRGDGEVGEDITLAALRCPQIPTVTTPRDFVTPGGAPLGAFVVRGECIMSKANFQEHFAADKANPRNTVAGALKRSDPDPGVLFYINFFAYDLRGPDITEYWQRLWLLRQLSFSVVDEGTFPAGTIVERLWAAAQDRLDRAVDGDFEEDGVVVRVNDNATYEQLGATSHHPRGAVAVKRHGAQAVGTLDTVEWSITRTGRNFPTAVLNPPVQLKGVAISRATCHNAKTFKELKLCHGDRLVIERRGDVIPYIVKNKTQGRPEEIGGIHYVPMAYPVACVGCGGPVLWDENKVDLLCIDGPQCPGAVTRGLHHWCQITEMDGWGPAILQQIAAKGWAPAPGALYMLKLEHLEQLDRVGVKLAERLIYSRDHKPIPEFRVLAGFGMPGLGRSMSKKLLEHFGGISDILSASTAGDLSPFVEVPSMGWDRLNALLPELHRRMEEIEQAVYILRARPGIVGRVDIDMLISANSDPTGPLAGKTVCFTGKLMGMDKKEAGEFVIRLGGTVESSLKKGCDFLVAGTRDGEPRKGSKWVKAEKQGTEVVLDSAFWARFQ
jgi:DNA ligase (NAD+)